MKLELKNISKDFEKKNILNEINFVLETGEIVSLVGRNGSGKTTILKIITGIFQQNRGEVLIDEENIEKNNLKSNVIYIPDKFDYFKHAKLKNVAKYYTLAYENFDFKYFQKELNKNKISLDNRVSSLSKGQTVIFSVILGLSCKTKFLLLDEPLDGIDVINIKTIINYIIDAQSNGCGILLSSHQLDYIENISDKIIYLDSVKNYSEEVNKENYVKYQIVYEDKISAELTKLSNVCVVSNIGRVYVVVIKGDKEYVEELIRNSNALQYDELPVLLEDVFVLNNRGGKNYD